MHVEYMLSLPLHSSQEEIKTSDGEYSDFQYWLCLTPELATKILSMGEKVEVLKPHGLQVEIKRRLEECLTRYR